MNLRKGMGNQELPDREEKGLSKGISKQDPGLLGGGGGVNSERKKKRVASEATTFFLFFFFLWTPPLPKPSQRQKARGLPKS